MAKKIDYASLYTRRKDGRYVGTYTDDSGQRHYVYDRDPEKLWHKLNDPKEPKRVKFKDIAEAWKDAAWETIRDGTKASYVAPYNRAIALFGDTPASDIQPIDLQNYLLSLKSQGLSASTIRSYKLVCSLIYQHAITAPQFCREITSNPAANLKIPAGTKRAKKREAPPDETVKLIKEKAETAHFGLFALFLVCTGFRRGEALAVTWGDIDTKNNMIQCTKNLSWRSGSPKIEETKTESGIRSVPLLPPLVAVLHKPKGAKNTDYVFYGEDPAKPMTSSNYRMAWLHYCKDMGFVTESIKAQRRKNKSYLVHQYTPTLTAHVLRHGYATMLYEAGVDVYTAQKYMGHADIQITMSVYTHLRQRQMDISTKKLIEYTESIM